jgi:hypothetical protein
MTNTSGPLLDTRAAAHVRVQASKQDTWARILAYGRWCGLRGFTTEQLAIDWGCDKDHVAPRVTELFQDGELILTKERRRTRSGCLARVYIVKQKSIERASGAVGQPPNGSVTHPSAPAFLPKRTQNGPAADAELLFSEPIPMRHRDDN